MRRLSKDLRCFPFKLPILIKRVYCLHHPLSTSFSSRPNWAPLAYPILLYLVC